jgi:thiosulfate dehydrogenase
MVKRVALIAIGMIVGFATIAIGVYCFAKVGPFPLAVSDRPFPFEESIARMSLHARLRRVSPKSVPVETNDMNLIAGARVYVANCAMCHGLPAQKPDESTSNTFPKPPQFFAQAALDDPPGEIYWETANGIRLTGMPAFKGSGGLSDTQLWQVALILTNSDKLPAAAKSILTRGNVEISSGRREMVSIERHYPAPGT